MNFQTRKQKILATLERDGHADLKMLVELLDSSEATVRRDLAALADAGLLARTHGGAMRASLASAPVGFAPKSAQRFEQKMAIARLASNLIADGDCVFLDCGSTVFQLCPFLKNRRLRIVTNSLPVIAALIDGPFLQLNFAGGEIDPQRQAAHGPAAIEHFKRYRADRAFVGIDGISLQNGLSSLSEKEAEMTRAMVESAREAYFLCDSSKLERDRFFPFAPLDFVQNLVTDREADAAILEKYAALGVRIFR